MDLTKKKKKIKITILLLLLFINSYLLFISFNNDLFISNVVGQTSDYDYVVSKNLAYEISDDLNTTLVNAINTTQYTGTYNATYSFTDGLLTDWSLYEVAGFVDVINSTLDGHSQYLELYDNTGDYCTALQVFPSGQESGSVEFYIRNDDITKSVIVQLRDSGSTFRTSFQIGINVFRYYDGVWHDFNGVPFSNTWYHVRIDFECGTGSYLGLSADTYKIWINGIEYGAWSFSGTAISINEFYIFTNTGFTGYSGYLDALGYSWNTFYTLDDNFIPFTEVLNYTTKDKYEWKYRDDGTLTVPYENNLNGWTDIEITGNDVYADNDDYESGDVWYSIFNNDAGNQGIKKDDFTYQYGIFNLSVGFVDVHMGDDLNEYLYIDAYSYDSTLQVRLRIDVVAGNDYDVYQYDGSSYNYLCDWDDYTVPSYNDFYLYWDSFVILNYAGNKYTFDLINPSKKGLSEVFIYGNNPDGVDESRIHIDWIGIYINGTSVNTEGFYFVDYNIRDDGSEIINVKRHHLFYFQAIGNFTTYVSDIYSQDLWIPFMQHNDTMIIRNIYYTAGGSGYNWQYGLSIRLGLNTSAIVNYIRIEGIIFTENTTEYYPSYISDIPNYDLGYFYASGNTMYYTLTTIESDLEYIEAFLDIPDTSSTNYSASINLQKNIGNLYSEFRVNYDDATYEYVSASTSPITTTNILIDGKVISTLSFLVSDSNQDVNNTITGYFKNVKLLYYPDIAITISILNFFEIVPVIAIIILLPIVIGSKSRLKFLIIPLVMIMSIISYISGLVPLWLTVVVNLFCIMYYFIKNKYSD